MDQTLKKTSALPAGGRRPVRRPSRAEAEEAVRTLLAWAGDDPEREGLQDTPRRVAAAYEEYFSGYGTDAVDVLSREAAGEFPPGLYGAFAMLEHLPGEQRLDVAR